MVQWKQAVLSPSLPALISPLLLLPTFALSHFVPVFLFFTFVHLLIVPTQSLAFSSPPLVSILSFHYLSSLRSYLVLFPASSVPLLTFHSPSFHLIFSALLLVLPSTSFLLSLCCFCFFFYHILFPSSIVFSHTLSLFYHLLFCFLWF